MPLTVPSKPAFKLPWRILEGGNALKCRSYGRPGPQFNWFFQNKRLDELGSVELERLAVAEDKTSGILHLKEFTGKNVGFYHCQAVNKVGHTEGDFTHLTFLFFTDFAISGLIAAAVIFVILLWRFCLRCGKKVEYYEGLTSADVEAQLCLPKPKKTSPDIYSCDLMGYTISKDALHNDTLHIESVEPSKTSPKSNKDPKRYLKIYKVPKSHLNIHEAHKSHLMPYEVPRNLPQVYEDHNPKLYEVHKNLIKPMPFPKNFPKAHEFSKNNLKASEIQKNHPKFDEVDLNFLQNYAKSNKNPTNYPMSKEGRKIHFNLPNIDEIDLKSLESSDYIYV